MQNKHLKETMIQEEKLFKDWELYLKNLYFGSKIQESYLRSFPKIPKSFTAGAAKTPIFDLNYASKFGKFIIKLSYPKHLQYSEDFIYGLKFAKKLDGCKLGLFRRILQDHAVDFYRKMDTLGIDYCFKGGIDYVLDKVHKTSLYVKKELLRKIFLFTLEGYLSDTNIHIDFETYDDWPINDIKFIQKYKNSGKLCREFFNSVTHIKF